MSEGRRIRVTFTIHPKGRFHLGFVMGLLKMKVLTKNCSFIIESNSCVLLFQEIINSGIDIDGIVLISDMEAFLDNEKVYTTSVLFVIT